jgi:glycerol-3-phosphate dehydrogenase
MAMYGYWGIRFRRYKSKNITKVKIWDHNKHLIHDLKEHHREITGLAHVSGGKKTECIQVMLYQVSYRAL